VSLPLFQVSSMAEQVVLVDDKDREVGLEEKMKAHEEAKLHRAFSIFVFNSKGQMLLQQRAKTKYHSGGLWTNACCSHPRQGEAVDAAAHRRLKEEMGFDCPLKEEFSFIYKVKLDHGLTEHEFDHILIGKYEEKIEPNPEEADGFKWIGVEELRKDVAANPEKYTTWFKIALNEVLARRK